MSLKDFQIHREAVTYRGVSVHVRGIAPKDITHLIRGHLTELNTLFEMYSKEETKQTAIAQSVAFAGRIVSELPDFAVHLIMAAADEDMDDEETFDHVMKFPIPLQIELVRKIADITFEEAGGAKKFIDSIVDMVNTLRPRTSAGD